MASETQTPKADWGNPSTGSFARYYLRWARYGDDKVHVNVHVWQTVNRILTTLGQADVSLKGLAELDDPLKRGFVLSLSAEDQEVIVPQLADVGFVYSDGKFVYDGTVEKAIEISKLLEAAVPQQQTVGEQEATANLEPVVAHGELPAPWEGAPEEDEQTDLALFVQALVGADETGVWDAQTVESLTVWQRKHGVEGTGVLDRDTWTQIVPARIGWLRPGSTGSQVKVIQAGFRARGYFNHRVDGIWGVALSQALRQFQADYRIHPRLRIGNPEWDALFSRSVRESS